MSPLRTCSIERHFIEQQQLHPEATGELTRLMHQLAFAAKQITKEVRSAGLSDILGVAGHTNVQGEVVQKLDEITNDVIYRAMDHADIERVVEDFAQAARRCQEADLDGVEVHVHGHLIGQFWSR